MPRKLSILLLILFLTSCLSVKKTIVSNSLDAVPVVSGAVVNADEFQKGGSLNFDSFKPGPGAAADEVTDQLSFMITKGIKDTLPEDNTRFRIPEAAGDADYTLDGYIEDYGQKGHMAHLSIDGQIWSKASGNKIFVFQTAVLIDLKSQTPKTVAYQIGIAIAHFIGSHST